MLGVLLFQIHYWLPYFTKKVSVIIYLDMLELYVFPHTEDDNLIFQQDGAPPHNVNVVIDFLDEHFLNIGLD